MDYYPLVIQDSHEKWMNMAHVQMMYIHIYIYRYRYYTPIRYGDLQPNCPKWMVLFCGDVTSQNCVARCFKQQTWWFNEKSIGVRWGYIWMNLMMTSRRDGN